jgi:GPH family glycoside/pentoside/hexuronide:cation symporter
MEFLAPQLSFWKKLFYGMGGVSMNLCDLVFLQWLFVRYAPREGPILVSPKWIGACLLFGRVFEAIILPLIGNWSDNFFSKGGRRLPFIRRGLLPWCLAIFLMWTPPFSAGSPLNGVYLPAIVALYLFLYNLVVNPYLSLMPELTSNLSERVDLSTFQAVFIMGSAVIFACMGVVLEKFGWAGMSLGVTILTVLFMLPIVFGIREREFPERANLERIPLFGSSQESVHEFGFREVA